MPISEDAKKAQLEYIKKWRKEHPDKVKQYQMKYWENVANQIAETGEYKPKKRGSK